MLKVKAKLPLIQFEEKIKSFQNGRKKAEKKNHFEQLTSAKWNMLNFFKILSHAIDNISLLSLEVQFGIKTKNGAKYLGD